MTNERKMKITRRFFKIRKLFGYFTILVSISLLSLIALTNFEYINYRQLLEKLRATNVANIFNNDREDNIQNTALKTIEINNIKNKENLKLLKNNLLLDLLDLKYDLLNEVYESNEQNAYLNIVNELIVDLEPRTKVNIALYNTNKTLFHDQLVCNEIDSGLLARIQ